MAGFTYAPSSHPSVPSSGGGGGAFGFVKNLVHDIGDAARGTPEGIVQLAEHPIRTTEAMGKATWQEWSPLFHGHVGEFGHAFYQHPLAPMLDIMTVFTGGAALAAKTGVALGDAGLISADSALYKFSHMPRTMKIEAPSTADATAVGQHALERSYTKLLPRNPIYNKTYRSILGAADAHPAIPDWFGSGGVYRRLQRADESAARLALTAQKAHGLAHAQALDEHLANSLQISAMMQAGKSFAEASKAEWKNFEQQLFGSWHKDLFDNSHAIPLQEIIDKYHGNLPHGYGPVRVGVNFDKPLFGQYARSVDQFSKHMDGLGKKFVGSDNEWSKSFEPFVYTDENGVQMVKLAHRQAAMDVAKDGAKSTHLLYNLYRYPTAIWKWVMVGASPRTVVDNTVGNWLMYAMRQSGAHGLHGFVEAVRYARGERKALQMLRETGKMPEDTSYFRHFKGELQSNTYGTATLRDPHEGQGLLSKLYSHSLYPAVHKYADVPVRAASISAYLKGHDLVRGLMKGGMSFHDAADYALTHSPTLRDEAIQHGRTVAGNYLSLSPTEHIIRDTVPFYLWDKHIVMHAANMLRDRPGVVAVGSALGQQGANATRNQLGDIPDWMIGGVPFAFGQPKSDKGRTQLLNTTGLNPYSSVPDLVDLAQALTTGHTEDKPGDTILGTVNPVIKAFVQQTMGQTATGAPVQPHGGVIPSMLTDIFNSLRPVQGVREAVGAGPPSSSKSGTPRLYKSDLHSILSTIAGFPLQQADIAHAQALQKKIETQGKKKSKKSSGFTYAGH